MMVILDLRRPRPSWAMLTPSMEMEPPAASMILSGKRPLRIEARTTDTRGEINKQKERGEDGREGFGCESLLFQIGKHIKKIIGTSRRHCN
jgi:hypothetical protein